MPMDWTPPPRGSGREPDLNQVLNEVKQRLPKFNRPKGLWLVLLAVLAVLVGSSAYYTVGPEETGVMLRFGKYVRSTGPGIHAKIPLGVEQAIMVKTGYIFKEEFGFRGTSPGVRSRFVEKGYEEEAPMLTGDLAVLDVKWIVQYQIRDPRKWLFAVRDGVSIIRDLMESVMRRIVGNRYSDSVLTLQRVEIAALAQKELQALLEVYQTGAQVVTVKLQDVNPPVPVQPAFNEVNEARQQMERMINEAQEAYNREIPKASGEAKRLITEAEGYATEQVNRAQGEAKRFNEVLAAYQKAKDVTQRRFHLDAMQAIINNAAKVWVVDESVKGLVPFMNLGKGVKPAPAEKEVRQ